ncbi:Transcriptional regulatory protein QseF [Candidatus Brocadiaceae bacterium]|nr:Transcriptional regulatory protein QseF [Candidatus Brocadiaceae bacterium]
MKQGKILLLDTDPSGNLGKALREIFEASSGLNVPLLYKSVKNGEPNLLAENISKIISDFSPNMIFFVLSHSILRQSTLLLQSLRSEFADIPAILVMEDCQPGEMFVLLKCGATDFITPPFKSVDILPRIWRLLEEKSAQAVITQRLKEKLGLKQIIGKSPLFLKEVKKIPTMARCDVNILISGETGTGKEVCARAIHYLSPRMSKPFMPVNCGAIPVELIENELFGHKSGAFTSANSSQQGLIQDAEGGTLFLDEIDCLPLLAQVKLLRFLQEKEYRPLGSTKICQVDVRVVAATNIRLEEAVKAGRFRQDLYYRLNIIPLVLPPLRERRDDVPLLADHFLSKYAAEYDKPVMGFSPDAIQVLVQFDWPGNVRELEHVIERAIVLTDQEIIREADIVLPCSETGVSQESFHEAKARVVAQFENTYIQNLLLAHQGNITKAAQAAQKNRRAFWQLMRKYRIDPQIYKSYTRNIS